MPADMETWKNATLGKVFLVKLDRIGNEIHEAVPGGRTVSILKQERLLNSDRAANEGLDVFLNGTMVPVRLLDGDEDAKDIASNPNLMGEEEMHSLFKGHWKTFEAKVQTIKNERTLSRMLDMAEEQEATVRQVKIIQTQLNEVAPSLIQERDIEQVGRISGAGGVPDGAAGPSDQAWHDDEMVTGKAVTPK